MRAAYNKRAPRTSITLKPEKRERERERRSRRRDKGREVRQRETTQNYAPLLMKQSPLRPCYLDVRVRRPHDAGGFGGRVQPSRRRQDFPRVHSASGLAPGPRNQRPRSILNTELNSCTRVRATHVLLRT